MRRLVKAATFVVESDRDYWAAVRALRAAMPQPMPAATCSGVSCRYAQDTGTSPYATCLGKCVYRVQEMVELSSIVLPWRP